MKRQILGIAAAMVALTAQADSVYSNDFTNSPFVAAGVGAGWTDGGGGLQGTLAPYDATYDQIFRNSTLGLTQLSLSGLPVHGSVSIGFLLAFLDSWDSRNGSPAPDNLDLIIDGVLRASYTWNTASGDVQDIGGGSLIATGVQFDVNVFYSDAIADMNGDPGLTFAHSASTLTLAFQASGAGWQGGTDEAWGIDNLSVSVSAVPEPTSTALMVAGLLGVGTLLRRRCTA